jgi:hypothetical protein
MGEQVERRGEPSLDPPAKKWLAPASRIWSDFRSTYVTPDCHRPSIDLIGKHKPKQRRKNMNAKSIVRKGNKRFAVGLFATGLALCACSGASAQNVVPPPKPLLLPDLVVSSLSAKFIAPNRIQYSWTITNVGTGPANLEGPNPASSDNIKVQAFVSKDTVFGNAGDVPAGGTIIGTSPLPKLDPQTSRSGTFTATVQANLTQLPHLVLKVDPGNAMAELNDNNNTAAVGIGR